MPRHNNRNHILALNVLKQVASAVLLASGFLFVYIVHDLREGRDDWPLVWTLGLGTGVWVVQLRCAIDKLIEFLRGLTDPEPPDDPGEEDIPNNIIKMVNNSRRSLNDTLLRKNKDYRGAARLR